MATGPERDDIAVLIDEKNVACRTRRPDRVGGQATQHDGIHEIIAAHINRAVVGREEASD
jgi:hypothetical protein